MPIDWGYVKKATLWHYEPLIEKLSEVLAYGFVRQYYTHIMPQAAEYARRLQEGYVQNEQHANFIDEIADNFEALGVLGVEDYQDLVRRVDNQARCEAFVQETDFGFEALIQTLNFIFRWVLPFKCPLKELVDNDSGTEMTAAQALKQHKIKSNLDVLETCRTRAGRRVLADETGINEALLLDLANRADITRLAYVRGKTARHLCGGGYGSLDKLAAADLDKMETDMSAYYKTLGKTFSDFKAVIPLDWMVGGARVLPKVMEA